MHIDFQLLKSSMNLKFKSYLRKHLSFLVCPQAEIEQSFCLCEGTKYKVDYSKIKKGKGLTITENFIFDLYDYGH